MIKLFIIFLLPFSLYGSKILSYNVYDRTDRVDVMITFDTPYEGKIKHSISKSKIIIKLEDAEIEASKLKKLSSKFIYSLAITPMSGYTQVIAAIPNSTIFKASKTSDAYGLRLRFTTKVSSNKNRSTNKQNPLSILPTKKTDDISQSYFIIIGVLIIGIGILLYLRKKVIPKQASSKPNAWLFKENLQEKKQKEPAEPTQTNNMQITDENVSIRFQKTINAQNSVVMLDFGEQSYLVLMGKSSILLDKFIDNKPASQEDFETILQSRHQELEEFLHVEDPTKEPLQSYKERAASIIYEEA